MPDFKGPGQWRSQAERAKMPRHMNKEDVESFRVIITITRKGNTYTYTYGPYHDLATARGIVTRKKKDAYSWRYPGPVEAFSAVIEKSPLFWETVERVSLPPII